jgi:hypothetical protein
MSSSDSPIDVLFDALAARTCRCLLFNYDGSSGRLDAIRNRLRNAGISVETRESDLGPANVGVFVTEGTVLDVIALDEWWPESLSVDGVLTDKRAYVPEIPESVTEAIVVSPEVSKPHLTALSREFEQRALRSGGGRLAVGFQQLSTFAESERTREVYERLAAAGVDVTAHGVPDVTADSFPVGVSPDETGQYQEYWFMLYDGDGEPDRKAALVAREQDEGSYEGYWSVDAAVVDELTGLAERQSIAPY